jgi:hypothetical protein
VDNAAAKVIAAAARVAVATGVIAMGVTTVGITIVVHHGIGTSARDPQKVR